MSGDKKLIYVLVALIIFLAITLLIKIKTTPKYDPKVYANIYDEYESIFGKEDGTNQIDENVTKNIVENNIRAISVGATTNNSEKSNVIGKIIIPKIEIKYPIIKETTAEYLKVAPTTYCGPEVNEVR